MDYLKYADEIVQDLWQDTLVESQDWTLAIAEALEKAFDAGSKSVLQCNCG